MKHLKRFNEGGSHDWRANFFPGASEEEIEKELSEIDKREKENKEKKPIEIGKGTDGAAAHNLASILTDDQWEMMNMGYPMSQVLGQEVEQSKKEDETKDKGIGSKIKSFLKFKK